MGWKWVRLFFLAFLLVGVIFDVLYVLWRFRFFFWIRTALAFWSEHILLGSWMCVGSFFVFLVVDFNIADQAVTDRGRTGS